MRSLFVIEKIEFEPLGILQLSSILKRASHDVKLVIASDEDPVVSAKDFRLHVVGYTTFTGTQHFCLKVNRRIKEEIQGVFSVIGGPHPNFFPEMIEEDGVDGVCLGEGEDALLDLAAAQDAGADYTAIPNSWLVYKLWKGYALRKRIHSCPITFHEFVDTVRQFMAIDTH